MICFIKCDVNTLLTHYIKYAEGLRLVDTFWEDVIIESVLYKIEINAKYAGVFSIRQSDSLLTSFHIEDEFVNRAYDAFTQILSEFSPTCAYCVSCDELFLSQLTDYLILHDTAKLESQAYFFDDIGDQPLPEGYEQMQLIEATVEHIPLLEKLDFFDNLAVDDPTDVKYLLFNGDELLGAGHIQTMLFQPKWGAVGMVTSPKHRQKGVGKAIIIMEKRIAREQGLIPIAGCWYYNHASKSTLESCGFVSKTRYLKLIF